ncbi:MAG: Spy/CpxP family protein refolding chaperone [Burkholderiaceae bacterium]
MPSISLLRRRWAALAAVSALSLGTGLALSQDAQHPHGPGRMGHAPSAEHMARGMERRIDGIIKAVDGTPEQRARLLQLSQAAMAEMKPLHGQRMAIHKQGAQLMAAPVIDRRALEALRVQQMALDDTISKRRVQHLADAAEVLTPAQRSKLAERMQKHGAMGHGRHGGMGFGAGFAR